MLQYVIAGLVLGSLYAIASAGLVSTYASSGVLNFAFGAEAYLIARFYYFLHVQEGWSIAEAGVVSILVAGPLLGVFLYLALFRFLRLSSSLIKVVATIGLAVAIPPIAAILFGDIEIFRAPGLAPSPVRVFDVFGVPVTMDQVIVLAAVTIAVSLGAVILRYTDAGLCVRALVDSEAMTSLSGTNPNRVSIGVWAVSTFFAGLTGVLAAPIIGLAATDYMLLIAAAFAAVIVARLRSLTVAVAVSFAMGVVGALLQKYLPPSSTITAAIIPSVPFIFIALFLLLQIRRNTLREDSGFGGALDRAIVTYGAGTSSAEALNPVSRSRIVKGVVGIAVIASLPLVLSDYWGGLVGAAMAFGIAALAITLVTGEGGMIWLCQITFAGVGALTTAQLVSVHGWPLFPGIVMGGLVALPMGLVLGALALRLGDLYVALVTLTFGLLMERLVFPLEDFYRFGAGVPLDRPEFAKSDFAFAYLTIAVFCVFAMIVVNLRKSTAGLALRAVRSSEPASRMVGLSVVQMKLLVSGVAAFIAAVGGAFMAMYSQTAQPDSYQTLIGMVWLAVVVTMGVRSNLAAAAAGMSYTFLPAIFIAYLPISLLQVPPALFGLGAIMVSRNPDGILAMHGRNLTRLAAKIGRSFRRPGDVPEPSGEGDARRDAGEPTPSSASTAGLNGAPVASEMGTTR